MSYHDQLLREINAKLDDLEEREQPWRQRLIAVDVCKDHEDGLILDGDHEHFWRHCGYEETMELIGQAIKRRTDPDPDEDEEAAKQPFFPGFEHLQRYYRIKRRMADGKFERLAVHINDMTDDELLDKAEDYDRQSVAMREHANELRRFQRLRRRPAAE
jgi:hypothetical protein